VEFAAEKSFQGFLPPVADAPIECSFQAPHQTSAQQSCGDLQEAHVQMWELHPVDEMYVGSWTTSGRLWLISGQQLS